MLIFSEISIHAQSLEGRFYGGGIPKNRSDGNLVAWIMALIVECKSESLPVSYFD